MTDWQNIELRLQVVDVSSGGWITYTTPQGILEELARYGVLEVEQVFDMDDSASCECGYEWSQRYVSKPWKEAK